MAKKYKVPLENPTGVILQTEKKYCDGIIVVTPNLQSKTVAPTAGTVRPDEGYCGLWEVTIDNAAAQAVAQSAITNKVIELSGTSGEFSLSDYADILTGADIIVNEIAFTYVGGNDENKCFAAYEVSASALKVVKITGKSWVVTTYTI